MIMTNMQSVPQSAATHETSHSAMPERDGRSVAERFHELEARIEDIEKKLDVLIARGAANFATGEKH